MEYKTGRPVASTLLGTPPPRRNLPAFRVVELKPIPGCGNLRAFATIQVGPLLIRRIRVVQKPGQTAWISPPTETWDDPETGKKCYLPVLEFPAEWKNALSKTILAAWEGAAAYPPSTIEGGLCE